MDKKKILIAVGAVVASVAAFAAVIFQKKEEWNR
jgi:hypothetical protein